MQPANIVLLQSDPNVAQLLASSLADSFHGVHVVRSMNEVRDAAAKHRPYAIIVDLEKATLADVEALKQDFQGTRIICNHRVADEEMWTRTLSVGADDCCPSSDVRSILSSAVRQPSILRTVAA
jgi:DNA-binding NarL/FixJ family response regulator